MEVSVAIVVLSLTFRVFPQNDPWYANGLATMTAKDTAEMLR